MSDGPCCAHLQVNWTTRQLDDGMTEGWWECRDCKSRFCPTAAADYRVGELAKQLEQEREYHRRLSYPEPFKVGSVLGRYKDLSYALQILHVWNTWPNVDIEVGLPFAPDGGEKHE